MINFSDIDEYQDYYSIIILCRKYLQKNKNISKETKYGSVEDPSVCTELHQMKQPLFQKSHI